MKLPYFWASPLVIRSLEGEVRMHSNSVLLVEQDEDDNLRAVVKNVELTEPALVLQHGKVFFMLPEGDWQKELMRYGIMRCQPDAVNAKRAKALRIKNGSVHSDNNYALLFSYINNPLLPDEELLQYAEVLGKIKHFPDVMPCIFEPKELEKLDELAQQGFQCKPCMEVGDKLVEVMDDRLEEALVKISQTNYIHAKSGDTYTLWKPAPVAAVLNAVEKRRLSDVEMQTLLVKISQSMDNPIPALDLLGEYYHLSEVEKIQLYP